ncbi:MAG: hypothetical protein RIT45_1821 [Pseudomonadota bacterium]
MARVLVIGATGHLGAAVAHTFAAAGWQVRGYSRAGMPGGNLDGIAIEWRRGGSIEDAVAGCGVVVDAAAPYPVDPYLRGGPSNDVVATRARERTERWLIACADHRATFVGIGSFVTHRLRERAGTPLRKRWLSQWIRGRHPYFAVKASIEDALLRAADRQPVVVLNPTGCLGPYDLKEPRLALVPRLAEGSVPVAVPDVVDFIDARDVALTALAALEQRAFGEPILLAGHSRPFSTFIDAFCDELGCAAPALRAPAVAGVPALVGAERVLGALGRPSPVPTLTVSIVLECGAMERSDAQRALGVPPRPLDETVRDTVRWYRGPAYGARWPDALDRQRPNPGFGRRFFSLASDR